jgi:hypothetical protein
MKENGDKRQERGWWSARFQMDWPEGTEPSWYVDALIAHRVISPALQKHKKEIDLWRFHRRAARDPGGHQFSFIFYSSPQTARAVLHSIQSDPDVSWMKSSGLVVRDSYDDPNNNSRPNIEDTSDKAWSGPVMRSWPYFIMGVSEMWLKLIFEYAGQQNIQNDGFLPLAEIQETYRQIHDSVEAAWEREGGHALLHHLNAIFGYKPVIVNRNRAMQF